MSRLLIALLALVSSTALATDPAPPVEVISNFVVVDWGSVPSVSLMFLSLSGDVSRFQALNGFKERDSWRFMVPEGRYFATFQEVIVHPSNHSVTATVMLPNAVGVVSVEPATMQKPTGVDVPAGGPYYVNLEHGISCEGAGCASLPPAR